MNITEFKKQIIYWARLLNERGFVTARSGNISCRLEDKILMTSHDSYLGQLEEDEIVLLDSKGAIIEGEKEPTSEKPLHLGIMEHIDEAKVIIHAHSPFTTAYFHYFKKLDIFSFEAKFYLGEIKVIPQSGPTVTDINPVIEELMNNNIVVLGNHGVVAIGKDFKSAFSLVELLEEQSKINLMFSGKTKDSPCVEEDKQQIEHVEKSYFMFSQEHIQTIKDIINNDTQAQELGKKHDLTCSLCVKDIDAKQAVCFYYQQGKITNTDNNPEAEFIIAGSTDILKKIFNCKIDPFVAVTQGKVKTKGDINKISQWYPALTRTFKLWEQVKVV